jgi:hypothetical protein
MAPEAAADPGAVVISFDAARAHFAARELARKRQRVEEAETEQERWLAELDLWPPAFRRRLRPWLERLLDPEVSPDHHECIADRLNECRARIGGFSSPWFVRQLKFDLLMLRGNAECLRGATARNARPHIMRRHVKQLEGAKQDVLMRLFEFGYQRVERSEIEPYAEEENQEHLADLRHYLERAGIDLASLRRRLRNGVCESGRNKGLPYTPERIAVLKKEAQWAHSRLAELRERAAILENEPDLLRAWGLYTPRREH